MSQVTLTQGVAAHDVAPVPDPHLPDLERRGRLRIRVARLHLVEAAPVFEHLFTRFVGAAHAHPQD